MVTRKIVCICEAPNASDASLAALGTVRKASAATVTMVGNAMIASTTAPAKAVSPTGRFMDFWMSGTRTTSPKKPYTTEGIPASNSITGLRMPCMRFGASSAI